MPTHFIRSFTALLPDGLDLWTAFDKIAIKSRALAKSLDGTINEPRTYGAVAAAAGDQIHRSSVAELKKASTERGLQVEQLSARTWISGRGGHYWQVTVWAWLDRGAVPYNIEVNVQASDAPDAERIRTALIAEVEKLSKDKRFTGLAVVRQSSSTMTADLGSAQKMPVSVPAASEGKERERPNWGLRWTVIGVLIALAAIVVSISSRTSVSTCCYTSSTSPHRRRPPGRNLAAVVRGLAPVLLAEPGHS